MCIPCSNEFPDPSPIALVGCKEITNAEVIKRRRYAKSITETVLFALRTALKWGIMKEISKCKTVS